ncbi:CerR family C-terminal domain-containing protein [Phaeovibrio sulfidiphilus]|uniref:CerR family C-terminal domain-containing protein n=1 Tax=Phaeovibrio sulfidiphilus TaxID=1220600 RepID=A0A8J6YR04_9PROT|nr:CerR family C-terminal domain-containing protein [Phaeovibrio sulfidiphilus]MBE1237792.1 CerR family C-terminal domain-containing protein [Phaeovibrio sulfidiphilus]
MVSGALSCPSEPGATGGDPVPDTRQRLLEAAIHVFGCSGFDGASTRSIARQAGANVQSIAYYFGNKAGLYRAAAETVGQEIAGLTGPLRVRIRDRLEACSASAGPMSREEATQHLHELAVFLVRLILSPQAESWARFIVREQMGPSEAFHDLYQRVMGPILDVVSRLVAILLEEPDPGAPSVRLRTLAFAGSVLVFRFGQATVLRQTGWQSIQDKEMDAVCAMLRTLVESLRPAGDRTL